MKKLFCQLVKEQEGQGLTEYSLILSLVAIVVIGALIVMGGRLNDIFGTILAGLNGNAPANP